LGFLKSDAHLDLQKWMFTKINIKVLNHGIGLCDFAFVVYDNSEVKRQFKRISRRSVSWILYSWVTLDLISEWFTHFRVILKQNQSHSYAITQKQSI